MEKLDVKEIIRSHGLKATPNRIAVYEYMLNSKEHPSAEMIKEHLNSLGNKFSLATVYNIIEAFLEKGVIIKVRDDENNMMRFDANTDFHVHIYNSQTNEITDYEDSEHTKFLEKKLKEIKKENNFGDEHKIVAEM
ncbi:Fur family transcriptional regulator [Anaerofustis stercorihominis]|uniref:Fur family transcriptional regulator n=1 Tax=Anaerofustis stercorihominis TaxID=214853 RepID=UPI00214CD150|nr:transcriptional repressor [Anaerofustis stercorihominis]MCR2032994.1 transcriptional repressor [Anaerofustis stercorihominis]